ncbi:helix-turn-helix domain-containing protein [Catellatospora vulcania]|uniref:helix-turn-helix domain-containing protein n=1 Tax=Catellatospora vulcania TaxID=1460450 RepID=UPI0012D3EB4B|nr:helix-turn-helix transcriptional regulator [Catellatospora vulcania]
MDETVGEALRRLRKAHGLSLRQLGRAVPVDFGLLSRIENNRQHPSDSVIRAVDAALNAGGQLVLAKANDDSRRVQEPAVPAQVWRVSSMLTRTAGLGATPPRQGQSILAVDERARELYVRGHGLLHGNQRREIEAAKALLDRAVGRDPRLAPAIADRGYARWRQYFAGWTDAPQAALTGALRDVEAALTVDPDSVAAHTTFIRTCWDMGWHRRALEVGRSIHLRHPDSLDAAIAYARALMNAGMAELALPLATSVLREDPTHPAASKLTIWCRLLLGQHELAVEIAKPYLDHHQGDANTRWAVALASANSPTGLEYALRVATEAIRVDDADITQWLLLGYLHRRHGVEKSAREVWAQGASRAESASLGANHRTTAWAANLYAALQDRTATMETVTYLIENSGTNGYIRYRLFHALAELGDEPAAIAMLDAAASNGFMSVQLMRQEEKLAPHGLRKSTAYRRVAQRLEDAVKEQRDEHVSPQRLPARRKEHTR